MVRLEWTEQERLENRKMTIMLLDNALEENKDHKLTAEQFLERVMAALRSLVDDDMITAEDAAVLTYKYVKIYDPDWQGYQEE